jgi:hypothetical protein
MLRLTSLTGLLALCAFGCGEPLSPDECETLLAHYTELLVREENPEIRADEVALRKAQAQKLAREEPKFEFAGCADAVSRRQFDCAMQAHDVNTVERCLML